MQNKSLVFVVISIFLSFSTSNAMYITPNNVGVLRGHNYTFCTVAEQPYIFYDISVDSTNIIFTHQHNNTHIETAYFIPHFVELRLYHFQVSLFDQYQVLIGNATYTFGIVNLTDSEIMELYGINEKLQDVISNMTNTTNNTSLYNPWADYHHESFWSKYADTMISIVISSSTVALVLSMVLIGSRVKSAQKTKQLMTTIDREKENNSRIMLSKKALKDDMATYREIPSKDGPMQAPVLDVDEKTAIEKISYRRSLAHFVRLTSELKEELFPDDPDCEFTSVDLIKYRFKEFDEANKKDHLTAFEKWCIVSGIKAKLISMGCEKRNDDLYPVGCNLKDIEDYLMDLCDEKDKELLNTKETGLIVSNAISNKLEESKTVTLTQKKGNVTRKLSISQVIEGNRNID